ncbi:hypothetical protein A1O7_02842 [Cladophialophora yegresii CBS 114405]|uniref:MACPF domain-containing protein n=1 Tax=Cladophialophora yegresii CBS 114405 TaxID=1182544 RepID=W9W2X2_9EURO|nr:uncharacterized protein A1O7_02842 [Cladophialophora yegresii CBS 114405]EXJ62407.1 hypothetical protein A1O7_02842 [Cladophialophora yegresii CBS 114405]
MDSDDDSDIRLLSISKHAAAKAPFNVPAPNLGAFQIPSKPFGPKGLETKVLEIGLFSGFDSKLANAPDLGPFQADSPFQLQDSYELVVTPLGRNSFSDVTSTSSSSSYEHLSASVGVGVDCVVFGGSVSVSYDKYVTTNTDGLKHSQHAVCYDSAIRYLSPPPLSDVAKQVLREQGEAAFRARFGDYFLGGFVTGAESGLLMSYAHSDREETDITRFTMTVKVLFWSASHTEETVHTDTLETSSLTFTSFNTLDPASSRISTAPGPGSIGITSRNPTIQETQEQVQNITLTTQALSTLVAAKRQSIFGTALSAQDWDAGCTFTVTHAATRLTSMYPSRILLQIQLIPYTVLWEYQKVLGSRA